MLRKEFKEEDIKKLSTLYKFDISSELYDKIEQTVLEIKFNLQSNGRSDEELRRDVFSGLVLEHSACKLLSGELNDQKFNHKIRESYAYDLTVDGKRIEVKRVGWNDNWFNFNLKGSQFTLKRPFLDTFLNNLDIIDYILVGSSYLEDEEKLKAVIKFKWLIDAKSFKHYIKESNKNKNSYTSHYYDIRSAVSNGDAIILNQ